MTTAFVLGGGGVLGAAEVGMLRALLERDLRLLGFGGEFRLLSGSELEAYFRRLVLA